MKIQVITGISGSSPSRKEKGGHKPALSKNSLLYPVIKHFWKESY